ncbi:hypothetical protein AB1Y20_007850 [Prymnesium parvum]|uniref:EamA domain-containing protein n=1 Tax=Prymnesium parvum TaxID=97485 RepID=A0AB34IS28_PRYPA
MAMEGSAAPLGALAPPGGDGELPAGSHRSDTPPAAPPPPSALHALLHALRTRAPHLCLVVAIAASQVGASQLSSRLLHEARLPPFFLMWFSTAWNLLLALPLLSSRVDACLAHWPHRLPSLALCVAPFYLLWAGANTLYTQGLALLPPPLVTALFSVTPALVALLSAPLLRRRLSRLTLLASLVAAAGVTLIARPWRAPAEPARAAGAPLLGVLAVLGAAGCAATYKVCFRRVFGEAPAPFVLLVLALLGGWAVSLGSALLWAIDGGELRRGEVELTPRAWALLCAKSLLDLAFNFLIAYGISITHPLFVSIGTLLSTPLNVLFELCTQGTVPSVAGGGGMGLIVCSFALILIDDSRRELSETGASASLIANEASVQRDVASLAGAPFPSQKVVSEEG